MVQKEKNETTQGATGLGTKPREQREQKSNDSPEIPQPAC